MKYSIYFAVDKKVSTYSQAKQHQNKVEWKVCNHVRLPIVVLYVLQQHQHQQPATVFTSESKNKTG